MFHRIIPGFRTGTIAVKWFDSFYEETAKVNDFSMIGQKNYILLINTYGYMSQEILCHLNKAQYYSCFNH